MYKLKPRFSSLDILVKEILSRISVTSGAMFKFLRAFQSYTVVGFSYIFLNNFAQEKKTRQTIIAPFCACFTRARCATITPLKCRLHQSFSRPTPISTVTLQYMDTTAVHRIRCWPWFKDRETFPCFIILPKFLSMLSIKFICRLLRAKTSITPH